MCMRYACVCMFDTYQRFIYKSKMGFVHEESVYMCMCIRMPHTKGIATKGIA